MLFLIKWKRMGLYYLLFVDSCFNKLQSCVDIQIEDALSRLETEYELQDKITAAYRKLTRDTAVSKSIRRSRDQCYRKAYNKVGATFKSLCDSSQ